MKSGVPKSTRDADDHAAEETQKHGAPSVARPGWVGLASLFSLANENSKEPSP